MAEYAFLNFPAEAINVDPERYHSLPESARRVFAAIREGGPISHSGLREATGLPPRTIRFAVKRLRTEGLVDSRLSLKDSRTCFFFVKKDLVGAEALQAARARAQEAATQGRLIEQV
ncbi:MAG TPA: winged helix-turn-helix domain-containing protein [Candidatus Thermoplasmatota archaeon]|nr:winged helix-turn-helix domain-containing protein [Candidatus Thermoplasmatota archaeon]